MSLLENCGKHEGKKSPVDRGIEDVPSAPSKKALP
jgi:hypothetical protein